jgi:NADH-quinone oxidoreductase subunit J
MMLDYLVFALVAAVALSAGLAVVLWRNLVHCVLWLTVVLVDTAAIYAALSASFMAVIQVMLYTGGIVTLMLFAIMMTRRSGGIAVKNETDNSRRWPALAISSALFGLMAWAICSTDSLAKAKALPQADAKQLARVFMTEHVLSFEVISILLLAATIGAVVIARRRDFIGGTPAITERGNQS